jgi:hypothetical protein
MIREPSGAGPDAKVVDALSRLKILPGGTIGNIGDLVVPLGSTYTLKTGSTIAGTINVFGIFINYGNAGEGGGVYLYQTGSVGGRFANYGLAYSAAGGPYATILNAGTLSSGGGSDTPDAVSFGGGGNLLIEEPTGTYSGLLYATGQSTLQLGSQGGSGTLSHVLGSLPSDLSGVTGVYGFSTIGIENGSNWTFSNTNTINNSVAVRVSGTLTNLATLNSPVALLADATLNNDAFAVDVNGAAGGVLYNGIQGSIGGGGTVANPLQVKAIAHARIKTDKIDAGVLASLRAADFLPEIWLPDPKTPRLCPPFWCRSSLPGVNGNSGFCSLHQIGDHLGKWCRSLNGVAPLVGKLDPSFIEAVEHAYARHWVFHPLGNKQAFPSRARHNLDVNGPFQGIGKGGGDVVRRDASWAFEFNDSRATPVLPDEGRSGDADIGRGNHGKAPVCRAKEAVQHPLVTGCGNVPDRVFHKPTGTQEGKRHIKRAHCRFHHCTLPQKIVVRRIRTNRRQAKDFPRSRGFERRYHCIDDPARLRVAGCRIEF